jgi:hypothetical protein
MNHSQNKERKARTSLPNEQKAILHEQLLQLRENQLSKCKSPQTEVSLAIYQAYLYHFTFISFLSYDQQ